MNSPAVNAPGSFLRTLYPPIEPYYSGRLRVSSLHELYYEESGNPHGQPVIFLHGGPGSGTSQKQRQFFDPRYYRIILLDQRGAGKSTPHACLEENTTWHLVEDLEKLRLHLHVDRWIVFGGSWGSTLALAYAISHPERVVALALRGIFTFKQYELDWLYKRGGASEVFPDVWARFVSIVPEQEHHDLMGAYHRLFQSKDEALRQRAACLWTEWEATVIKLIPDKELIREMTEDHHALAFALIENHYFRNKGFFPSENYLVENIDRIHSVPAVIVHGRYDMVCPLRAAWDLHQAWPQAELHIVPDAGHSVWEPGITHVLVEAMDRFRSLATP